MLRTATRRAADADWLGIDAAVSMAADAPIDRTRIEAQLGHSNGEAWSMGSLVLTKFAMHEDFPIRGP